MDYIFDVIDSFINTHPGITALICLVIIISAMIGIPIGLARREAMTGKNSAQLTLTPTQKFILAASSPTIANNYKCVIDIWDTRESSFDVARARELFEWSWGKLTYENARKAADDCMNRGYNAKYKEYCSGSLSSEKLALKYTDFELRIFEETKKKYPGQGMLGWDLVRVLSIVGGAYMGGIMEYKEAAGIALTACRMLQENFSSWDDMVGSYTLGYQFWRGKKKKDRLRYYKSLKRSSRIYEISWDTPLREEEL
ncbi:MAG: DUF1266 domain-containing protein [Lachnospiraceae bacterium]|nr:DUF1266 domain-containing protein [Lachnospiraceae bacterium]